jgi:hypothetical protein
MAFTYVGFIALNDVLLLTKADPKKNPDHN